MEWSEIKKEYITTDTSYRKLADKYGVSRVQIGNVAKREGWVELRRQHLDNILTKSLESDVDAKAARLERIYAATDTLLDKIERAISELDIHLCKKVKREKTIEYNNEERPDKPTREVVSEEEEVIEVTSTIDRAGLKQIASAIRDIKESTMVRTELDDREQEARIDKLRRDAEKEDGDKDTVVKITIEGGAEDWQS